MTILEDGVEHPTDVPPEPNKVRKTASKPAVRTRPGKGTGHRPKSSDAQLREQIEFLYAMGGALVAARGRVLTGSALQQNAKKCAAADVELLNQYPRLKETFERFAGAGGLAGVIVAHWPIILAVRQEMMMNQPPPMRPDGFENVEHRPPAGYEYAEPTG